MSGVGLILGFLVLMALTATACLRPGSVTCKRCGVKYRRSVRSEILDLFGMGSSKCPNCGELDETVRRLSVPRF